MKLTVIVGMPGSGKTYLGKKLSAITDDKFIDDFSKSYLNVGLLKFYLEKERNVIIADPMLCFPEALKSFYNFIKEHAEGYEIEMIFFENNKEACIKNVRKRKDGRKVDNLIEKLSEVYEPTGNIREVYKK